MAYLKSTFVATYMEHGMRNFEGAPARCGPCAPIDKTVDVQVRNDLPPPSTSSSILIAISSRDILRR